MLTQNRVAKPEPRKFQSRKNLLIFPQFQLSILGINLGVILIVGLIVWASTERALGDLEPAAALSGMEVELYKKYLNYQLSSFRTAFFIAFSAGVIVSGVVTLFLSHRFAGPLVRMRGYFRSVSESTGPVPELHFRDGDYLGDFPNLINKAMSKVRKDSSKNAA